MADYDSDEEDAFEVAAASLYQFIVCSGNFQQGGPGKFINVDELNEWFKSFPSLKFVIKALGFRSFCNKYDQLLSISVTPGTDVTQLIIALPLPANPRNNSIDSVCSMVKGMASVDATLASELKNQHQQLIIANTGNGSS